MSNKIWFITGASRGIGAEIAKAALAAGDRIVATGRDRAGLEKLYASYGERVLALALDVASEQQAQAAVAAALERFDRIDVLVNNAGYGQLGLFEEIEPADIERQFATNVFGLMHVTRAVLPAMRRQRAGHVFNLSSIGGVTGFKACAVYSATKFAVEGFSESLAQEVQPFGIHVTVVEPGFFRTDFLDARSVRYGARRVEEYHQLSGEMSQAYEAYNHQQPGDPARLGQAFVTLSRAPNPPLHYAAGSDALEYIGGAIERRAAELRQWQALTLSTDIVAAAA
ncbi:SDR family NAD(P)-dependent oxidoreductase [Solimonas sp. K1W22B-7]|uniref:oxidoreductase n=1 Tax=Solimonas sp. K1W22B-7 TaxID=2303331 RepID=UPI000E32D93E|nr:oxidoreductase [Solimonas sp. K1W22B-7]AXQ30549.1 SDR family NAD(P)-dependent oxidoreductase [Solimonas sp. K1W22B-7]